MDNQHLRRNSSRQFPPRVSQSSEMGPSEQEGGSERRFCVRVRTWRRERLFPLPEETQSRGNGAERIIKAGKRGWKQRGGAYKNPVLLQSLRCQFLAAPHPPSPNASAEFLDSKAPSASASGGMSCYSRAPRGVKQKPSGTSLPSSPPIRTVAGKLVSPAAQKCYTSSTQEAGPGLPLTSYPGGGMTQ